MASQQEMKKWNALALKTQMNPHFVFNALNAIQYFILSDDKKSAIKYLSLFSKLLRYHLKYDEAETVNLGEELRMLEWYLQLQKLRYQGAFNYQWLTEIKAKETQLKIPRTVLSALFEGAIEGRVFNKVDNDLLNLSMTIKEKAIEIMLFYSKGFLQEDRTNLLVDYREDIMPWQEQIQLLNHVKSYDIKAYSSIMKDSEGRIIGGKTFLVLPILA